MPRVRTEDLSDAVRDTYDQSRIPVLDVDSPQWQLQEGQASVVVGLDVVRRNRFRPERGRRGVGLSLPEGEGPATTAFPVNSDTLVSQRIRGTFASLGADNMMHNQPLADEGSYTTASGALTKSGAFPFYNIGINETVLVRSRGNDEGLLSGLFPVISRTNDNTIVIPANLTSSDLLDVDFILTQGEYYIPKDNHLIKSPALYDREGPWPESVEDSFLEVNSDQRARTPDSDSPDLDNDGIERFRIESRFTWGQKNDSIEVSSDVNLEIFRSGKFNILHLIPARQRGIIVGNGRKFWLFGEGTRKLVLDLGSDTFLGTSWEAARISTDKYMLVSSGFAPRILRIDSLEVSQETDDSSLAGLIPPRKPTEVLENAPNDENDRTVNPSWVMDAIGSGGSLTAGNINVLVRLVNYDENLFSDMVSVVAGTITAGNRDVLVTEGEFDQTVGDNDSIRVTANYNNSDRGSSDGVGWHPPIHTRASHLEIWRTISGGGGFLLEHVVEIASRTFNEVSDFEETNEYWGYLLRPDPGKSASGDNIPLRVSDTDLQSFQVLSDQERRGNGLPPICKDVVSMQGVTILAGRGKDSPEQPVIHAPNIQYLENAFFRSSSKLLSLSLVSPVNNWEFVDGDRIVVEHFDKATTTSAPSSVEGRTIPPGTYDVASVDSGDIFLKEDPAGLESTDITATGLCRLFAERPYTIEYPRIRSDEDIWYSRTDTFAPESFPFRVLTVSRIGDKFRRLVIMGRYTAVIMDQGVHLLRFVGGDLVQDTLGETGFGTPWGDSVVRVQNLILWASVDGIRALQVTNEPNTEGSRGRIRLFDEGRFSSFFQDALDNNESVDAGFDSSNSCIRFRRKKADHVYSVLQFSFRSNQWTILENDNGFKYVSSSFVESDIRKTPALYSVDPETGALFEVNSSGEDTYNGLDLSGSVDSNDRISGVFSSGLVGEIIRIRTDGEEYFRTILTASTSKITFSSVPVNESSEFTIAPIPFKTRLAFNSGRSRSSSKTLEGIRLRARKGERTENPGSITLKAYVDFDVSESVDSDSVPVYNPGDPGRTDDDAISSLQAQGYSIAVELSADDARSDFDIELFEVTLEEETSRVIDTEK